MEIPARNLLVKLYTVDRVSGRDVLEVDGRLGVDNLAIATQY